MQQRQPCRAALSFYRNESAQENSSCCEFGGRSSDFQTHSIPICLLVTTRATMACSRRIQGPHLVTAAGPSRNCTEVPCYATLAYSIMTQSGRTTKRVLRSYPSTGACQGIAWRSCLPFRSPGIIAHDADNRLHPLISSRSFSGET